jgi:hypothetical protein
MLIIFFGLLLWFELGRLPGGYSQPELLALQSSNGLRHIFENPVNAPFSILVYLFGLAHLHVGADQALLPVRAAATVIGLLTLTSFYWLVRYWHGERSAILGTVIFGCSAWFLHTARLGTPDVLAFLLIGVVATSTWLKQTENPLVLLVGFGMVAGLLYIPGMVWLLLVAAIWQIKTITRLFKEHIALMSLGSLGVLALITPLVWAIYRSPETAKIMAGLPADKWPTVIEFGKQLLLIPYHLVVRAPLDPVHWLARLPILDVFCVVMFLLGGYLYLKHLRLIRAKMVAAILAVGTVLVALGGAVSISILIPFIYLLVAAGMGLLMDRWQAVFPRNVIAQAVSVVLISIAVITVSWYGLRHYFVAWPNAPATKQVFVTK